MSRVELPQRGTFELKTERKAGFDPSILAYNNFIKAPVYAIAIMASRSQSATLYGRVQRDNGGTNLKSRVKLSFRIWTEEGDDSASERQSMSVTIVFALPS
jgi:hypothetical protein